MDIATYMKSRGLDDAAMAALVGNCSASAVKKWKYRERTPRAEQLRKIVEITGGKVTPNDFAGIADDHADSDGEAAA